MYLTDKKTNVIREVTDHEELEVLLEFFEKQVEEIVNEAENIQVYHNLVIGDTYQMHTFGSLEQCPVDSRNRRTYFRF